MNSLTKIAHAGTPGLRQGRSRPFAWYHSVIGYSNAVLAVLVIVVPILARGSWGHQGASRLLMHGMGAVPARNSCHRRFPVLAAGFAGFYLGAWAVSQALRVSRAGAKGTGVTAHIQRTATLKRRKL